MENDEKRTQSQSRVHHFFTRSRETNRSRRCDEQSKRARPSTTTRRSKATTHPITGVAATALDAENRAALRAVKSENVRTTTVSHYASTRACRFTPSFPPRPGGFDPGRASAPQTDRASRVPAHRPMRGVSRASHDVRDERKRADDARRNRTKFTASFVPSASIGVHRRRRVVASSIHPSESRSNPASHSKFFLSHERSRTHPPTRREPRVDRSRPIRAVPAESSSVSRRRRRRPFRVVIVVRFASVSSYKNARVPLGDVGARRGRRRGDRDGAEGGDGGHADDVLRSVCAVRPDRTRSVGRGRSSRSVGRSRVFYIGVTHQV